MATQEKVTINEWSDMFYELYKNADHNRSPEEYWNAIMSHLSGMGEAIRRSNYPDLLKSAAHAFAWMCGYVKACNDTSDNLFKIDNCLSEIVAIKFPGICGHCLEVKCRCRPDKMDAVPDKSAKYNKLQEVWITYKASWEKFTLGDWLKKFKDIYRGQIHLQTMESIGFHLLEESGEEAKAVRQLVQFRRAISEKKAAKLPAQFTKDISSIESLIKQYYESQSQYRGADLQPSGDIVSRKDNSLDAIKARVTQAKVDLIIEMADTFSWYCAVLIKMKDYIESLNLSPGVKSRYEIENVLKEEYQFKGKDQPLICYGCQEQVCNCI